MTKLDVNHPIAREAWECSSFTQQWWGISLMYHIEKLYQRLIFF